jgi:PAS domain S-box-containing protein
MPLICFWAFAFTFYVFIDKRLLQKKNKNFLDLDVLNFERTALNAHAIVSIANPNGEIVYANENFCKVSGYSIQELLGSNHRILKSGVHAPEFYHDLWETISQGNIWQGEICNRNKSGDFYWVKSTIVPYFNVHGAVASYVSVRTDITEQKKLQKSLNQQLQKFKLSDMVISHANDLVVITDAYPLNDTGPRITFVNKEFERVTGYSEEEVIGKTPRILQGVDTDRDTLDRIRNSLEKGQSIREDILNYTKSGEPYWLDLNITPVTNEYGLITHFIAIERDVTQRKVQEDQLKFALENAQVAIEAKNRFIEIMSHELRTPINQILGMAQLLQMGGLTDDEQHNFTQTIIDSSKTLTSMVNQVIDYSAINNQKDHLNHTTFRINQLIIKLNKIYQPISVDKNIKLYFDVHGLDNQSYWGDKPRIFQMLSILIDNAFRFTKEGSVLVEVKEIERVSNSILLEFAVSDSGIGIPLENVGLIFKPFSQVNNTLTRQHDGLGLSLAVLKDFAEMMGGHVDFASSSGVGSRFSFCICIDPR